ncbi:uncharacterized membrane-anchored protein YjiN (DUF445 family) [Paenibacillus cellulosilyticus]|uniref:Uncharacterized membrane-anchored protein YjiN (DUF445 family) n=1 Tax=Paenibacillus cellulosilyticus TaxID=375489 RepID=A0A2V2YRY7_9BACL|nr:DUF445 domain-containing protein [Paenibacillus cellulosilyticus]PWW00914.1 uncharacterized membrane-anchored protein YjiN (DUF445 family) [Paenibacillus cellulosilyticus]QKS47569.1 DUF445 domain-containing protein [Paenibacillus cellulosilyticus]
MRSRYLAIMSLAVMACGFILTLLLKETTLVKILQGGFEAGLVGGLADWFAVTALFRHPMGIPIPHTSLLLRNRDKIIRSLISALENELLNKASIENRLRKLKLLQMGGRLLTRLFARRKVRTMIIEEMIPMVQQLPLEKAAELAQSAVASVVRNIDMKLTADRLLTKAMEAGYDELALDYVLKEAHNWAKRPTTKVMLGKLAADKLAEVKMGGLMGFAVQAFAGFMDEDKMGGMLQGMVVSGIAGLQDRDNEHRDTIMREIRVRLFQWAEDEESLDRVKGRVLGMIEGGEGKLFMQARLEELRSLTLKKLEEQRQTGGRVLFTLYASIVRSLNRDPERITNWENKLLAYAIHLVETNHYRIGQLVKENLDQMDDAALVSMLEEKVGSDLQWIRVNGALCGFLVGIVLSLFQL